MLLLKKKSQPPQPVFYVASQKKWLTTLTTSFFMLLLEKSHNHDNQFFMLLPTKSHNRHNQIFMLLLQKKSQPPQQFSFMLLLEKSHNPHNHFLLCCFWKKSHNHHNQFFNVFSEKKHNYNQFFVILESLILLFIQPPGHLVVYYINKDLFRKGIWGHLAGLSLGFLHWRSEDIWLGAVGVRSWCKHHGAGQLNKFYMTFIKRNLRTSRWFLIEDILINFIRHLSKAIWGHLAGSYLTYFPICIQYKYY